MIVYWSILAYTCFIGYLGQRLFNKQALSSTITKTDENKTTAGISLLFAILSFFLLIFFVANRGDVGDTAVYRGFFNGASSDLSYIPEYFNNDNVKGPGFYSVMTVFKAFISTDFFVFSWFLGIFQGLCVVRLFRKYSVNFVFSCFLFITSTSFTWMLNGIRQFLAISIILCFIDLIIEKKPIKFIVIILLVSTIHSSALIWIPCYFIVNLKALTRRTYTLTALACFVLLILVKFTNIFEDSMSSNSAGLNPVRVLVEAVPIIIAIWKYNTIKDKITPSINVFLNSATISIGIFIIAMFTSGITIGRIPGFFNITNYILLPWLINNAFNKDEKRIVLPVAIIMYILFFWYSLSAQGWDYYASISLNLYV